MAEPPPIQLDTPAADPLQDWLGKLVVLDTQGPMVYIGTLMQVTGMHLVLVEADVHDASESPSSKDLYILETRDLGVKVNRGRVVVERRVVTSASLLADVRN